MAKKKDDIDAIYKLLDRVNVNENNIDIVNEANLYIGKGEYKVALRILEEGINENDLKKAKVYEKNAEIEEIEEVETDYAKIYPKGLNSSILERQYLGMLLNDLPSIGKYYVTKEQAYFSDPRLLEVYKILLFTDAEKFAPRVAKDDFNFANITSEINVLKLELKEDVLGRRYKMEHIYVELRKLFILRKNFLEMPIEELRQKVVDIVNYKLYKQMNIEETENAVEQVTVTKRFKQSILNESLTKFFKLGENNLIGGLDLPFPIITNAFKGIRKGETMAFAMPSNAGKSRFTLNLASSISFAQKKKVLIISNEMSEDKMKLCLITTIINNERFQELHGQKIRVNESELLDFKFKPDSNKKNIKVDENGYILQNEDETREEFAERLSSVSTVYNSVLKVIDWVDKEISNSLYFVNITDHTNDELQKIIMKYYYKEQIEYIFYDTLKADTEHIGSVDEVKKTATILSNLAQNFNLFICSTLQLTENSTMPLNLNVTDLSSSRTVKEVLDTLALCKQIHNEFIKDYEYSLKEVDTEFFDLIKYEDPDVRYYACVIDKNRAGAKPTVLFRLNLAYNVWEELGYLRIKQNIE